MNKLLDWTSILYYICRVFNPCKHEQPSINQESTDH